LAKVAITGALGHIGSCLIRNQQLRGMASEILLFDDVSTQRYHSWFNLPRSPQYTLIEGDLRETVTAHALRSCDVVVHLAANTQSAASTIDPLTVSKNLELTRHVAERCLPTKIPLIFASTTSVYGSHDGVVDENVVIQPPSSPYATMKLEEESFLLDCYQAGLPITITRFGTIFGVSPGMQFHTAVNKFCWQAATRSSLNVWSTALNQSRPYLHVADAAASLCHTIMLGSKRPKVVNIVGENATVRQVLMCIKRVIGEIEINVEMHPAMGNTSYVVATHLARSYGYLISRSLQDGIEETMLHLTGVSVKN